MSLTRHMVTIDGRQTARQVHYRRQGQGPAVLLLHQSPQSSREFEPLMASWSENFTVIAPDTPGYGLSDPLPDSAATMEDLALSVVEFLFRKSWFRYYFRGGPFDRLWSRLFPAERTAQGRRSIEAIRRYREENPSV